MPKIKPSALVSDIKGKSNGSVFSKNSGGLYFRNNPSGGGKKSAKWDLQKSRFSSLAQAWKSLTEEQQEAWNSIAPEYQTTGAFGDIRNPSGYEVFMRLNGTLSAINRDILVVPISPRTIPSTGLLTLEYPDEFQLNPVKWGMNFINGTDAVYSLDWVGFFDSVPICGNYSLAFRWKPVVSGSFPFLILGEVIIAEAIEPITGYGYKLSIIFEGQNVYTLAFTCQTENVLGTFTYSLVKSQIVDGFHFGFVGDAIDMADFKFFLDGDLVSFSPVIEVGSITGGFTADLKFFTEKDGYQFKAYISDFRYYNRRLENDEMYMVSNGYILDDESIIVTFTKYIFEIFSNESEIVPGGGFSPANPSELYKGTIPMTSNLVPLFKILTENVGIENTVINVFASAGVSTGRNGSYSNLRLIGTFNWENTDTFQLVRKFKEVYKNISPNTQVRFEISVVDTETGFQDKIRQAVPPRRPRFKAGSELTDKVN